MTSVTTEGNMARLPQGSPGSGGGNEDNKNNKKDKDNNKDNNKNSGNNKTENSVRNNGSGATSETNTAPAMTTGGETGSDSVRGGGDAPASKALHSSGLYTTASSTATGGGGATAPSPRNNNQQRSKRCCFFWCCCCRCSCINFKPDRPPRNANPDEPPPTIDEIRAWSDSFDRLMRCSGGRQAFRDFLKCEYSEENILFWQACEELKVENNPAVIEEKARLIYEDYISILSPKEVSLDSRVREIINRNMVDPTPHTFDEAQMQIYTLMHRDSYPRFINSALYKRLAQLNNNGSGGSSRNESAT